MPLYFAYGANLDRVGMAQRCPEARPLGPALLRHHRFIIMASGYATAIPAPGKIVHGLLWQLPAADLPDLDAYEEVDQGLYERKTVTIAFRDGDVEAEIYSGASATPGPARPGYMEAVVAAAGQCALPSAYLSELRRWLPRQ